MSDGHDTGCTYRHCAHPESENPCPFAADVKHKPLGSIPPCDHEWRQLNPLVHNNTLPRFFCIHCKKIEK
jgi:hypothetical protein